MRLKLTGLVALFAWTCSLNGQTAVGPELRVNTFTTGFQGYPAVAPQGPGGFLIGWEGATTGATGSVFQRFDASGAKQGAETLANGSTSGGVGGTWVGTFSTGDFVFVWDQGLSGDVLMRRFSSGGSPASGDTIVNQVTAGGQYRPRVAMLGSSGFVVSFVGPDASGAGIFARRFDSSGNPLAAEFGVNTTTAGTQYPARVAGAPNGSFVVTWPHSDGSIRAQLYVSGGNPLGGERIVGAGTATLDEEQAVAMDANGKFVVAWKGSDGAGTGILARVFGADGSPITDAFVVNGDTTGDQKHPSVAADPAGNFVVAWEGAGATDPDGIYARRFSSNGLPLGAQLRVNTSTDTAQTYPSVSYVAGGSGFVVAWNSAHAGSVSGDVYAQRYAINGEITGDGSIDVFDVVTMMSYVVGNVTAGTPPFNGLAQSADVNRDNVVDVFDVVILMSFIVGNVPSLPV